jgi:hypothetical protein
MTDAVRPEDVLADGVDDRLFNGVPVRKGSVAAFVASAKNLERLAPGTGEYETVAAHLRDLVPAIAAVGLLDVFEPRSATLREIIAEG